MKSWLLIGIGSCAGGVMRYGVSRLLAGCSFFSMPLGTFCVNVAGCLLLGVFYGLLDRSTLFTEEMRLLFVVGFCGSFTTFSTFSADTVRLLRAGDYTPAVCYVVLSIAVCLLFTALGMLLGSQTRTA